MNYIIDQEKLEEITRIINQEIDPKVTAEIIEAHICADWHEGEEHQEWIDNSTFAEIADWVIATAYEN